MSSVRRWCLGTLPALAVLLATLAACDPGSPVGSRQPSLDDVRAGRAAYGPAAEMVGSSVLEVVELVRLGRQEPAASDPDGVPDEQRSRAVAAVRDEADRLATILDDHEPAMIAPVDRDGEVLLAAADEAWTAVVAAARGVVAAARAEADLLGTFFDAEQAMAEVVAGWDEPGSRSQQRERFGELVQRARGTVTALEAARDAPGCSGALRARLDAAQLVSERTQELATHVERGQGAGFDEARARFAQDPWHDRLAQADDQDAACWQEASPVVVAAQEVEARLDRLVEALNVGVGNG